MLSQAGYRRAQRPAKKENGERWLLTYADLITLLLAFFVIMYGMSSADVQKFSQLAGSMRKAFNVDIMQGGGQNSILDQQSAGPSGLLTASSEGSLGSDQASDFQAITSEMNWINQQEGLADKVSFAIRPEGIAISLSGNLLFASGRAELRPDAVDLLQALARILARMPNHIRVEGHTDNVPPSGTEFYSNWELSGARAIAVVRYLTEVEGIDPSRLSAVAFSQYQPVAPNDSPRSRAKNRRSEIVILYPATSTQATSPDTTDSKSAGS